MPAGAASAPRAWSGPPAAVASGQGERPKLSADTNLSCQRAWLATAVVILLLLLLLAGGRRAWYMSSRNQEDETASQSSRAGSSVQSEDGQDFSGDAR